MFINTALCLIMQLHSTGIATVQVKKVVHEPELVCAALISDPSQRLGLITHRTIGLRGYIKLPVSKVKSSNI